MGDGGEGGGGGSTIPAPTPTPHEKFGKFDGMKESFPLKAPPDIIPGDKFPRDNSPEAREGCRKTHKKIKKIVVSNYLSLTPLNTPQGCAENCHIPLKR